MKKEHSEMMKVMRRKDASDWGDKGPQMLLAFSGNINHHCSRFSSLAKQAIRGGAGERRQVEGEKGQQLYVGRER